MKSAIKKQESKYNEYIRINNTPATTTITASSHSRSSSKSGKKGDKATDKSSDKNQDKTEKLRIDNSKITIRHDPLKEIKSKINKLVRIGTDGDDDDGKQNADNSGSGGGGGGGYGGAISRPVFGHIREITVAGANKYDHCTFDKKYTNIGSEGELKSKNQHIVIGKNDHCYATLFSEGTGFNKGTHCWRTYYYRKKSSAAFNWLYYGLYPFGVLIENSKTFEHDNVWGIGGNPSQTFHNGKRVDDKEMQFLYLAKTNMVDMYVDFDKGIMKYTIVSDLGIAGLDDSSNSGGGSNSNDSSRKASATPGKKDKDNTLSTGRRKSKHHKGSKSMNIKDFSDRNSRKTSSKSSKDAETRLPDIVENNKEYVIKMDGFNKELMYTIHFNFYWKGTELQVAKINPVMFGKNTKLVQWAQRYDS